MYLDPGFGGMLIQVIIAVAAAGGVIVFTLRKKIRNLFSKNKKSNTAGRPAESMSETTNDIVDVLSDD